MEENRFFRSIWRLNGVGIFLLLILALGAAGFALVSQFFNHKSAAIITNVAQDPQGEEKWALGSSHEIDGCNFLYLLLISEKKAIEMSSEGMSKGLHSYGEVYFEPSRNILFVNKSTGEMIWLFNGSKQLIKDIDLISVSESWDKNRKIDAILYQVIIRDTNDDKQISTEDKVDVALSLSDGSRYKEVIQSVDRIFGTTDINGSEILILYQSNGKGYVATVRLADMSVLSTKEMPKVEQTL